LSLVARLSCRHCGSKVLQRSHARGAWERILRAFTSIRPWRCDGCGRRQLSPLRPSRRALNSANATPEEAAVAPASTPPKRKRKGQDPLEARIAAQRRKKQLWAAVLVVVTGIGLGLMVSRSPSAQGYVGGAP
jgi:DNA-directed RNA polymerase subunit RPC12/RpoP